MPESGSIVRCRNREWVLLPAETDDAFALRPLAGTSEDVVKVHRRLADLVGYELPFERVTPASFPLPTAGNVSDAASAYLLWHAARLTLREGAAPLRSLGRISIRPRVYQFVPLLMALRLNPVRLFIADDVGVGKTIEALLIARELLDRGEIRRFCVLCPPYLCEQWARELAEKFNLEPAVIRSGTVGALERETPPGHSLYEHFPIQVVSIDFAKSDRNRHQFLQFCPELVIVDEAHGAADASGRRQQERHALLREVAGKPDRHLILLTATPHSGVEEAFRSLLRLLRSEFGDWNIQELDKTQRAELARHFVQRTRSDIERTWEAASCFPKREPADETFELSDPYRELFDRTHAFCTEIVQTGERLEERKRRVRYWGALALLRCVMSSPAAAREALARRGAGPALWEAAGEEPDFSSFVFEPTEERTNDESPAPALEAAEGTLAEDGQRKLRELARLANQLAATSQDTKLERAIQIVQRLVQQHFHPILWCRYIATAEYLAEHLRKRLNQQVQIICVTGRMGNDEREAKIAEIDPDRPRVLVATDCLSEGVNLQDKFTAVVHYDLPWNPNRLEQREGRVDRYGQLANRVKAIRFFGRDNPVDGIVIDVLLNKARDIHRTLGTHVPVPEESESVAQALLEALFFRRGQAAPSQLTLGLEIPTVKKFHERWERDAERERVNRTLFAQHALKPEHVQRELEATDAVLGDPDAVRDFVLAAAQRIDLHVTRDQKRRGVWAVALSREALTTIPEPIRLALPQSSSKPWLISFDSPTPEGAEYLGRNHRFVAALARFLFEQALENTGQPAGSDRAILSRCGAVRTRAVQTLTVILLLRVRYLLGQSGRQPLLAEEVQVLGFSPTAHDRALWLENAASLRLLAEAKPDANLPLEEKRELVERALSEIGEWQVASGKWGESHPIQRAIRERVAQRAADLAQAHKRIRQAVSQPVGELEVKPQFPPDLLGILLLQPLPQP